MLFFLNAVSIVLILTGGGAALFGAETIRTESGAALAIVGAGVTCAGLLLLAAAQILRELRKLRRIAEDLVPRPAEARDRAPLPPLPDLPMPPLRPGPREESEGSPDKRPAGQAPAEPELHSRPEPPVHAAEPGRPSTGAPAGEGPAEAAGADGETASTAPEHPAAQAEHPAAAPSTPEATAAGEEAAGEETAKEAEKAGEGGPQSPAKDRNPIATYNSGGNTYFMYADGTIEAETPRGRFRFNDMAELRTYAETGEGGVRIGDTQGNEPPPSS